MVFLGMVNFKHTNDGGDALGARLAPACALFGKEVSVNFDSRKVSEQSLLTLLTLIIRGEVK